MTGHSFTSLTDSYQVSRLPDISGILRSGWQIDCLRGERVHFNGSECLLVDITIKGDNGRRGSILMATIDIERGHVTFPSRFKDIDAALMNSFVGELDRHLNGIGKTPGNLSPFIKTFDTDYPPGNKASERLIPGYSFYGTLVAHLRRYRFARSVAGERASHLDLGCGMGYGLAMMGCRSGMGIDVSGEAIGEATQRYGGDGFSFQRADLAELELKRKFAVVTGFEVIEHLPDHHDLLRAAAGALEHDGLFVISVPNPAYHGSDVNPYHLRDITPAHMETMLEEYFDEVRYYHQGHDIHGDLAERYQVREGLDPEAEFWLAVCGKPRALGARPVASIVIPLYNNAGYTAAALTAIAENTGNEIPFEVVLVDNASSDETPELLSQLGGDVVIRRNESNLGFARACNQGALLARGKYIVFLNNDTEVKPGWLAPLVDELATRPATGLVGSRLLYPDGTIQHAGVAIGRNQIPFHIHRGLAADDPLVIERRSYPMVTAACAAVRRREFYRIGMFDEAFVNGHEDIDLCLRYRQTGKEIIYRPDSVVVHHESKSEGRLAKRDQNLLRLFDKWRNDLLQDDFRFAFPPSAIEEIDAPLSFAIKIGVPYRSIHNWGDIFFAEGLARAIVRKGHNCRIDYLNEWGRDDLDIDVVIHIKGLSEYKPKPHNINFIWVINHPSLHSDEELSRYDAVLVASLPYARKLGKRLPVPVISFPQATDPENFRPHSEVEKSFDLVFVGNNRGTGRLPIRQIVADILPTKHRLGVWGNGWSGILPDGIHQGNFVPNDELPKLYSSARIVLNDHQPEMKEEGFVNNRTFDAIASGSILISDAVKDQNELLPVYSYRSANELKRLVDRILRNYGNEKKRAGELRKRVLENFTFDHRAKELLSLMNDLPKARQRAETARVQNRCIVAEQNPLVSIMVSTYNRRQFLPDTLRSIKAQTHSNWELFLVNDGGEPVDDIVARANDPRIKLINLDRNHGKAFAINRAFEQTRGEFVAYQDDDDIWYPDHLERLLFPLLTIPGIDFAYSAAVDVTYDRRKDGTYFAVKRELVHDRQVNIGDLLNQNHIQGIIVVHRRDLFANVGGMDEKLKVLIDWDLWRRMSAISYPYHVSSVTADRTLRGWTETTGIGHLTSLHMTNPAAYSANRLRILKKPLALPADSPLVEVLSRIKRNAKHDFLIRMGERHEQQGLPERAEIAYRRAARANPEDNTAHRQLGLLALRTGRFDEATDSLIRCVEINGAYTGDFLYATLAAVKAGRGGDALSLLDTMERDLELTHDIREIIGEYRSQAMELMNPSWEGSRREMGGQRKAAVI